MRLLAVVLRLLPPNRRELGQALLAELHTVPAERRAAWIAGGVWFVLSQSWLRVGGYLAGVVVAAAVVATVDRIGTSDDAGQVVLAVLLLVATLMGVAAPRLAWLTGLVVGAAVGVAHLGGDPWLFVLVVPAVVAAQLGGGVRRLVARRH
ncbi:hypothetical protein [Kutzneria sp. NPDC051319]|uniref:hypothetical protein n=1 Tax=Kutzneria sp. NPDC051319 TaxID=3155047 RepID=UPI003448709D